MLNGLLCSYRLLFLVRGAPSQNLITSACYHYGFAGTTTCALLAGVLRCVSAITLANGRMVLQRRALAGDMTFPVPYPGRMGRIAPLPGSVIFRCMAGMLLFPSDGGAGRLDGWRGCRLAAETAVVAELYLYGGLPSFFCLPAAWKVPRPFIYRACLYRALPNALTPPGTALADAARERAPLLRALPRCLLYARALRARAHRKTRAERALQGARGWARAALPAQPPACWPGMRSAFPYPGMPWRTVFAGDSPSRIAPVLPPFRL